MWTLFSFLLTLSFSQAQYFTTSAAAGNGGASLGVGQSLEGHLLNPAVLVHGKAVEGGLHLAQRMTDDSSHNTFWGGSLASNDPQNYFPGALTFLVNRRDVAGIGRVNENFVQFSVGEFVATHFSIGFAALRLSQNSETLATRYNQWNGVLGAHWNPVPEYGFGFTWAYMFHPAANIPESLRLRPLVGVGLHALFDDFFRFRADILQEQKLNPNHSLIYKGGFETLFVENCILRVGFRRDENRRESAWTAGLGFDGPRLKIDYTFERNLIGLGGASHSVDFRMVF